MKLNLKKIVPFVVAGTITLSCGDQSADKNKIDDDILDPKNSLNTDFDGKIFSIPSPFQMALLLKETNLSFNENLINDPKNISKYTTEHKQALNLGIYGADLGYTSINDQNSASLKCLTSVESLTNKLGLNGIFNKSFMTRFEKNKTNQDSVLVIVSEAFRNGDNYLKKEKRKYTSALILTGGWIESLYFACELNKTSKNKKIINRIGEQQETLSTIIEILKEYNNKGENDKLIAELQDLELFFDQIKIEYNFVKPKTNEEMKTTILQHETKVKVKQNTLDQIANKIILIRENIIH